MEPRHRCLFFLSALGFISTFAGETFAQDGSPAFSKFVDVYFDSRFDAHPSEGTAVGFHQYDLRLEDMSKPKILARIADLKSQHLALSKLKLTRFDDQIDAKILEGQILSELFDLETLRYWEINPMVYAGLPGGAIDGLMKRDFAPAADRLRLVIAREQAIPAIFLAAKSNLTRPPKEFTDLAIRMAKGSVGFFEGSVNMWAKEAAGADIKLYQDFDQANKSAIAAVQEFAQWLESSLRSRSDGKYAIGAEHFQAKMKYDEMVEMPLDKLLARGEAQLAKDYAAFVATARGIDPKKTPAEVMQGLSNDHPTANDLIPSVRRW